MHGVPVIYANDNFGRGRSDFTKLAQNFRDDGIRGRAIVNLLQPAEEDYFIWVRRRKAHPRGLVRRLDDTRESTVPCRGTGSASSKGNPGGNANGTL